MMLTIRRVLLTSTAIAALLLAVGCAETTRPKASGKGSVRAFNAIVTSPELLFRAEESAQGNVNFRGRILRRDWDDLSYNFNFDLLLPGDPDPIRLASEFIDVIADIDYTLVITGTIDNASIIMWEDPERVWAGTETIFEADFAHLSPQLGQVDVYYATAGTVPMVGNEIGTVSNGERLAYQEFPEGDYVLTITAPGDPSTVLFESETFPRIPAEQVTIALFDPDPSITASIGVNLYVAGGQSQTLADANTPAIIRTAHAAFGTVNFDAYLDDDFGNLIFPNIGFTEVSDFVDQINANTPITFTEAGDSGAVLLDDVIQQIPNSRQTVFLWGQPGNLAARPLIQDARPLETFPVVRLSNFSSNFASLDVYEIDPGIIVDDLVSPKFIDVTPGLSTGFFDATAGTSAYVITSRGEKDAVSTPLIVDMVNGDIVDIMIVDTADPLTVELVIFESTL